MHLFQHTCILLFKHIFIKIFNFYAFVCILFQYLFIYVFVCLFFPPPYTSSPRCRPVWAKKRLMKPFLNNPRKMSSGVSQYEAVGN